MRTGLRHEARGNSKKVQVVGFALCIFLLVLCVSVPAQQPKKVFRVGYLSALAPTTESYRFKGIRSALRELGYIDGQNITLDYRYSKGKTDLAPTLAAELVSLKVDLIIVAGGDTWISAARNATKTIPIVMVGVGIDPVEAGHVKSLAHPGGNVTGVTNLTGELGGKRLELLKETVPKFTRLAVLSDPAIPSNVLEVKELIPVARALGVTARSWDIRAAHEFDNVFEALKKERPDGLYVSQGPLMNTNQKRIVDLAASSRLPAVYIRKEFVEVGGLMSYGADQAESYRLVATYVDKILKGAKPEDLPIEQPRKFELIINLKAAKQIGLTIPQRVLARADKVIR